jgi:hypothetical protein
VVAILRKRRRHRDAERALGDADVDAQLVQGGVDLAVELGDGQSVDQRERAHLAATGFHDQGVVDEVEIDLKRDALRRVHGARRQSAHVDVERHVPPVVARRGGRHPDLADDLRPQVQRLLGGFPVLQRQRREMR